MRIKLAGGRTLALVAAIASLALAGCSSNEPGPGEGDAALLGAHLVLRVYRALCPPER